VRFFLEQGVRYRALVRANAVEKMLVNHATMHRLLGESGLTEVVWRSVRGGFVVVARYSGPSADATLPARVVRLERLKK